ncbi:MAG: hypothetical protein FJ012_09865 [Chloroflexi bacterium]|nr:hypothetical protein [Chloroflexota bacterium]
MRIARVIAIAAVVLMVLGLFLGTGCGSEGPQGIQGPAGSFGWGTPMSYGPYSFSIGTGSGSRSIPSLKPGDRVTFTFTGAGADVYYWVHDPYGNAILIGNSPYAMDAAKTSYGQGAFIAATAGTYRLAFSSIGILTSSVITVSYTVYPGP